MTRERPRSTYEQPPTAQLRAEYLQARAEYENAEALLEYLDSEEYAKALEEAAAGSDPRLTNGEGFTS